MLQVDRTGIRTCVCYVITTGGFLWSLSIRQKTSHRFWAFSALATGQLSHNG